MTSSSQKMFDKPSAALMVALRDFVFRHEIFVEGREFDDGFVFTRQRKGRSKRFGPRRNFEVFLRLGERRVHVYSLTCAALFGYVRSESRLLLKLLGVSTYKKLLRLVRSHRRAPRARAAHRRPKAGRQGRRA